ncbi:MAG TPA: reverse transcriptase family protein, partial [Allocoleopsis sp.]
HDGVTRPTIIIDSAAVAPIVREYVCSITSGEPTQALPMRPSSQIDRQLPVQPSMIHLSLQDAVPHSSQPAGPESSSQNGKTLPSPAVGRAVNEVAQSVNVGGTVDFVPGDRVVRLPHLDLDIPLSEFDTVPLTEAQFQDFVHLIHAFSHVFGKVLDAEPITVVQHRIHTGNHAPVHVRPYRAPIHLRQVVQQEIDALLQAGVIVPSSSPWSASVVVVDKKDGTHRLCIDYRRLNAITTRDSYPIPRIQDILDSLAGSGHVFTTLDLLCGFYQVSVHPNDREKTAFSTEHGHWGFIRMPFGLTNSPATFQRLMDVVLQDVRHFARCYIDDVVIFSRSIEEHLQHLSCVFNLLLAAGLVV